MKTTHVREQVHMQKYTYRSNGQPEGLIESGCIETHIILVIATGFGIYNRNISDFSLCLIVKRNIREIPIV